jgi:hypothetical protein
MSRTKPRANSGTQANVVIRGKAVIEFSSGFCSFLYRASPERAEAALDAKG